MQKLSKLFVFILLFILTTKTTHAASSAFPKIKLPCDQKEDIEFHSLRPYQAAACGDANKAYFCSNDLIFIETFDVLGMGKDCRERGYPGKFTCHPDATVDPHTLYVQLDDSALAILGNTEKVTNSQGGTEELDDATKVNEYASWYLSGVNNRAEYGENTDDRVVNYSGPVQKLLPKTIQEAERLKTIQDATFDVQYKDEETGDYVDEPLNHNQVVVCANEGILGIWGKTKAEPCYDGNKYRLKDWNGDLSSLRSALNFINPSTGAWNKRFPPLPWDDGTVTKKGDIPVAFKSQVLYQKAYNEWQGKSCIISDIFGLVCIDNPLIKNKWAELYNYVPLSSTTDKKGAEWISDVQFRATEGTAISGESHGDEIIPAALWMAHTEEVRDLSETLNKTYLPNDFKSVPVPKTTEDAKCSVANVRTNPGDNLFPGDPDELQVPDVTYKIEEGQCVEQKKISCDVKHANDLICDACTTASGKAGCESISSSISCTAQVYITIKTGTKTPNATEIFKQTVADSGSTFRKIFPKVEKGAPVECIANIPTVSSVTYTTEGLNVNPIADGQEGEYEFKVKKIPEDGAGEGPELTFPHIGSVYEYFLKGIQTALRPKGYGEPIANGTECLLMECGELPDLPKGSGSCSLGSISSRVGDIPQSLKDIVEAAAETYKVPPNLILGQMFGEGLFNGTSIGGGTEGGANDGLPWSDANVKNWATCSKVPNCNDGEGDDGFLGFYLPTWKNIAKEIKPDLLALDPKRIQEPNRCNLIDAIYGLAWNLHDSADGGFSYQCFGYDMNGGIPSSCSWKPEQYIAAIKVAENGYTQGCFTRENSCAEGAKAALCENGIDGCETKSNLYSNPSHMRCVYEVAQGK